jgi:hypothetical protein
MRNIYLLVVKVILITFIVTSTCNKICIFDISLYKSYIVKFVIYIRVKLKYSSLGYVY